MKPAKRERDYESARRDRGHGQDENAQAASIARDLFGVDGEATHLPGEFDLNFRVGGRPVGSAARKRPDIVLKLSPASRRPVLELAASALRHLEAASLPAQIPRVLAPLRAESTPVRHDPEAHRPRSPVPNPPATARARRGSGPPGSDPLAPVEFRGAPFVACAVTWVPGVPFAALRSSRMAVLEELGRLLAETDLALAGFDHPELDRDFPWRMESAPATIRARLPDLDRGRDLVAATLARALRRLDPLRPELPRCVIHNDANDHNVIAAPSIEGARLAGLIDFGDVARGWRVSEVAIAAAYAMLELADPVEAACAVARGYAGAAPLTAGECRAVIPLVALRLCLSVCVQAREMARQPDNAYLAVSQKGAWRLLRQLARSDWRLAEFRIREAGGLAPNPATAAVERWIRSAAERSPVMPPEVLARPATVDLSVESADLPWPSPAGATLVRWVEERLAAAGATVGVGRWGEARLLYDAPGFREAGNHGEEARTIHLGLDLFAPAGTPVLAPLAGEVVAVADNDEPRDYGPTVILRHGASAAEPPADGRRPAAEPARTSEAANGYPGEYGATCFHTLYGHLDRATLRHLAPGPSVRPGQVIGWLGDSSVNGGWPPHLHFQVIALPSLADDHAGAEAEPAGAAGPSPGHRPDSQDSADPGTPAAAPGNFPGVALERLRTVWEAVLPDPAALSGLDPATETAIAPADRPDARRSRLTEGRRARLGPSLSLSYRDPLHIVRGRGAWLYDDAGRGYLDTVNNVPHVGHGNARVAEAIARQSRILNTNTRYLHEEIVALADELTALLSHSTDPGASGPVERSSGAPDGDPPGPGPLEVVFLVCSGSEANELALRMARCHTGREGVVCVEGGYHGNTTGLVNVSQYKFDGPGGRGAGPGVAVAAMPDPYRGRCRVGEDGGREEVGTLYADDVARAAARLNRGGGPGVAAFIVEPILSCGGQIEPPPGYLAQAFAHIRQAGGVCIADEVQVGFGRVGDAFWGFELQGVVPDIVTLGKPMGNGHPVAAVVTSPAIADSFANGMEYFSTFGGNPVSCAAARAVLAEIREHGLQEHARRVGDDLMRGLRDLAERHPVVGDVRGRGLFLGIELVQSRQSREPFPEACTHVVNRARRLGVLLSVDGPDRNVIKIKPPLVFGRGRFGNDGFGEDEFGHNRFGRDEGNDDASLLLRTLDRVLGELPVYRRDHSRRR